MGYSSYSDLPFLDPNNPQAINYNGPSSDKKDVKRGVRTIQKKYAVDDRRDEALARRPSTEMPQPVVDPRQQFLQDLMDEITAKYQAPASAAPNFTPLDEALKQRIGAIEGIREQVQGNYKTSDQNLAEMFGANQQDVLTRGAQGFNDIGNQYSGALRANTQQSVNDLRAVQQQQMAERQAMLKNLGIEAAGASPNISADAPINQAIASISNRGNTALQSAEGNRAANLAFNQNIASSIGQQGAERRAALTQQLQGILGRLGMAEADYRSQDAQQRAAMQTQYDTANQGDAYQQWHDRQQTLMQIYQDMLAQQNAQQNAQPTKVQGFAGLAQSLLNSQYNPDQVSEAMGALSDVLSTPYRQNVNTMQGYSTADLLTQELKKRNINPAIAAQLATEYANLGNNASYTALQ